MILPTFIHSGLIGYRFNGTQNASINRLYNRALIIIQSKHKDVSLEITCVVVFQCIHNEYVPSLSWNTRNLLGTIITHYVFQNLNLNQQITVFILREQ